MIRNATARQLLYDWHGGQWSAFYGAASSGLVALTDRDALLFELDAITSKKDRDRLREWLTDQISKNVHRDTKGRHWIILPWGG